MTEGWWKYAKPGDKVVCVSMPTWSSTYNAPVTKAGVAVGKVYSILEVSCDADFPSGFGLDVGTRCPIFGCREIVDVARFRPVQPKSTEASMKALRKHLNTKEVVVDA